jgi:hypothetical protein
MFFIQSKIDLALDYRQPPAGVAELDNAKARRKQENNPTAENSRLEPDIRSFDYSR